VQTCSAGRLKEVLALAERGRFDGLFIDMPPAFDAHTLSIISISDFVLLPMRPTILELGVTRKWIELLRSARRPFGIVINGAPPRREGTDAPAVRDARAALRSLGAPLWPGQVTHRLIIPHAAIGGRGVAECDPDSPAAVEYAALWRAIDRFLDTNRRSKNVYASPHAA
jgi:cellulose biosynthesis protein BcsQ